jgi:hypothetical protein
MEIPYVDKASKPYQGTQPPYTNEKFSLAAYWFSPIRIFSPAYPIRFACFAHQLLKFLALAFLPLIVLIITHKSVSALATK